MTGGGIAVRFEAVEDSPEFRGEPETAKEKEVKVTLVIRTCKTRLELVEEVEELVSSRYLVVKDKTTVRENVERKTGPKETAAKREARKLKELIRRCDAWAQRQLFDLLEAGELPPDTEI